jgi:HD-GYP domain-containing protein (c-di-GMP phosphodiesterase class II)
VLAEAAGRQLRLDAAEVTCLRRAALLHDLGRVGVASGIWDKPGPLTTSQWEQVRLHPYHSERILVRSVALAPVGRLAVVPRDVVEELHGAASVQGAVGPVVVVVVQPAR